MEMGRLLTAMVTPFDAAGEVDYPQAKRLAKALINSGSDGVVVSGTTGESPTLTKAEKLKLFNEIRSVVKKPYAVVAGTGSYSTAESVKFTREARETGVDAALLVVPYYNKPTQEGLFLHFKHIAEQGGLPCIMYNVPGRTVANLGAETAIRLSKVPNIIGLKEASANLDQIAKIIEGTSRDFMVWSGNDGDTLPIMALGGYGVVAVASHLVGRQIKGMIEDTIAGRMEKAAATHRRLLPLVNSLFCIANPIPVKYALNQIGFNVGSCRLPLTEADEKSAALIRATLKDYEIDLPLR